MSVSYERINWEDSPSTATPINAENLNKMDEAISELTDVINEDVEDRIADVEDDVTDLKADLNKLEVETNAKYLDNWRQGYINASGGIGSDPERCTTYDLYGFEGVDKVYIEIKSGYAVTIAEYASNDASSYIKRIAQNVTDSYIIDNIVNRFYRFHIVAVPASPLTPQAVPTDAVGYRFKTFTDTTFTMPGKAADSSATGVAIEHCIDEINRVSYGAYESVKGKFEVGSILNGVNSTTTTRIRHTTPISYDRDLFVFVKSGFRYYVAFYNDAQGSTYLYTREFVTNNLPIIIKAGTYFRMVICKTTEETVADVNAYVKSIYVTAQLFSNPQIYKNNLVRQAAHQGLSSNPANTTGYCMVESYVNAAKAGFTHGELDIVFSYDGVPFCCHDATFTDATTSETVTIASKTAEELKTYNYHGGKIATFDEVVKTCKMYGMGVYIDHLDGSWTSDKWTSLFAVIQKYNMAKNTFWLLPVISPLLTNPITTWYANANFVRVFTTVPSDFPASVTALQALKTDTNIVSIDLPASAVTANDMPTYTAQIPPEIELEIWTVDTVTNWYSYLPYVSAITSNKICANIARQIT